MSPQLTSTRVEPSGNRTNVCHYDELSERAKDCLVKIADSEIVAGVDPDVATELVQYDLIKFVDYYSVQRIDASVSGSVSV